MLSAALLLPSLGRAFDEAKEPPPETHSGGKPVPQPKLKGTGFGSGPTDPFATSKVGSSLMMSANSGSGAPNQKPCDPKKDKNCKPTPPAQTQQAAAKGKAGRPKIQPRGRGSVDGGHIAVPGQQNN